MNREILERIAQCQTLPSLPAVAAEVLRLGQKERLSAAELSEAISKDPAIAAKVLRYANSPFFGLRCQVTTLTSAVVLLGLATIRTIALGFSLAKNLSSSNVAGGGHTDLWKRSLIAATAGRELASSVSDTDKEEAFLVGLLQNIGVLVWRQLADAGKAAAASEVARHTDLPEVERRLLGADHAEMGAWLAERWNLPADFCTAIRWHHDPEGCRPGESVELAKIAGVSDLIAEAWICEASEAALTEARLLAHRFWRLDDKAFADILDWVAVALPEISGTLEIQVASGSELDRIQSDAKAILASIPLASLLERMIEAPDLHRKAA